jgi:pyruvate/2-oxoglutarate/acetoin dehydrogenase E1 component
LAALFQEELYDELDGPVVRIAALDVPMPYNIPMEHYSIPDVNRIVASIRKMF